ncbi:hypothetical protein PAT3040_03544 [Paenibacillus agaridevorans]|uniref:Glucuronate isomerase n=1 Tax=Paenibacillus agaridevorans TaxID=171404 RepID=A0A2R5ETC3_9BACL|nr:glucuronate isomerase [Paenibacillus agaridevorans]GBG08929.1 hypothetical protein PAT3040_03544 [Paenibacillus agaridevorans]
MAKRHNLMDEVMELEVFDTHTHLIGEQLSARDFWEIADYFWLSRELQAGGYPSNADKLPEQSRISAFLDAYDATRNTLMNIAFTRIFKDLYGIEIKDEASVREADNAVRETCRRHDWAQQVADKLKVRRYVVNYPHHVSFAGMRDDAVLIPRIDGQLNDWVKRIADSSERSRTFAEAQDELAQLIDTYHVMKCPGVMTTLPRYEAGSTENYAITDAASRDQIMMRLLHCVCERVERRGMLLQIFLGVERTWSKTAAAPANDTERILKLYGLFERYSLPFELVVASELNNMDVVQAAWNFPNVHVGGMWWYNFRTSTYRDSMQYRLEALPAHKNSLIVSDARCIEWTYGKIVLVKKMVAEFLEDQLDKGWIDRETAIKVAKSWLYESALKRYGIGGSH